MSKTWSEHNRKTCIYFKIYCVSKKHVSLQNWSKQQEHCINKKQGLISYNSARFLQLPPAGFTTQLVYMTRWGTSIHSKPTWQRLGCLSQSTCSCPLPLTMGHHSSTKAHHRMVGTTTQEGHEATRDRLLPVTVVGAKVNIRPTSIPTTVRICLNIICHYRARWVNYPHLNAQAICLPQTKVSSDLIV